jgi:asparagine synthase (glutamine-hydrolysing)
MQLQKTGLDALSGRILCFGRRPTAFGEPIDWHQNPETGDRWNPHVYWSLALGDEGQGGDVKLTWEAGRFPHAYHIARTAAFFPELAEACASGLLAQMMQFIEANSDRRGIHWTSGQEIAIRAMSWVFALDGLLLRVQATRHSHHLLREWLVRQAQHVRLMLDYARIAVYNNHLLAEALFLFFMGSILPGSDTIRRLRDAGHKIIVAESDRQFYHDGAYIQLSYNYHRAALQYLLFACAFARSTGNQTCSHALAAMARSLDFLLAHQNPVDGRLPNYGSNDGALPAILSTCDFSDFRPTLQAVSIATRAERVYEPGPWDEESAWFFGPQCLDLPLRQPTRKSVSFNQTGFHVLRSSIDEGTYASFRCGSIKDRFSQIDMLNVDIFWKGQNVLVDGGSYLYNGPPKWHDYFMETHSHNTVVVDGLNQMTHYRKFKCLYWTQAALLDFGRHGEWTLATGEHYGYRRHPGGCVHRRSVAVHDSGVGVVRDTVLGKGLHRVRLHWLAGPFPWSYKPGDAELRLETESGEFTVRLAREDGTAPAADVVAGGDDPVRGWLSRYYWEKVPVPSLVAEVEEIPPVTFLTIFGPGHVEACIGLEHIDFMSGGNTYSLDFSAGGALEPA